MHAFFNRRISAASPHDLIMATRRTAGTLGVLAELVPEHQAAAPNTESAAEG